jgi:hypothetical protein
MWRCVAGLNYLLMIPVKIQCGCGQRYAFDVEPVAGLMPGSVSCPICGVDGTTAANAVIAQHLTRQPAILVSTNAAVAVASPGGVAQRVALSADPAIKLPPPPTSTRVTVATAPEPPATSGRSRLPGQMEPERAEAEAKSKIMWGDSPADVSKFLLSQGFTSEQANGVIASLLNHRAETVRKTGIHKIVVGSGMVCVPVIAFIVFKSIGVFPLKIFGAAIVVGVWGAWRVLSGIIMVMSPRSEKGDVADM